MNLIDKKVTHKKWGVGIVINQEDNYITVEFATKPVQFSYPNAFETYLVAEDSSVQEVMLKESATARCKEKEKSEAIKQAKILDALVKMYNISEDYNAEHLALTPILTYQKVEELFGIKIKGFGRGINITNTSIVLISSRDKTNFVYHDHWTVGGDYIYSGEGKSGPQPLKPRNIAVINANSDNKEIHLFVKLSPQEYYYQGVFTLENYTYEDDEGENGKIRKEYKFRLRKVVRD